MFTEAAGARKGFPRVAVVITDGKSQDPVEGYAKRLKNAGVEIFTLGMWSFITAVFHGLDFFCILTGLGRNPSAKKKSLKGILRNNALFIIFIQGSKKQMRKS